MSQDLAPYAVAPTSILVYRGKGVLVRRCKTQEEAVQLAIEEFELTCPATSISLTTFVGIQGREVEVGRSAFSFLKDTIPIHVHVKEEDQSENREAARWPAVSLDPQPLEYFGESLQPSLPSQLLLQPTLGISKRPNSDASRTQSHSRSQTQSQSQSQTESLSDWKKESEGTLDTATSIHHTPPAETLTVRSPEQMTAQSTISVGQTFETELTVTHPEPDEGKGKQWNWWKKAGAAIGAIPAGKKDGPVRRETDSSQGTSSSRRVGHAPEAGEQSVHSETDEEDDQPPALPRKQRQQANLRDLLVRVPGTSTKPSESTMAKKRESLGRLASTGPGAGHAQPKSRQRSREPSPPPRHSTVSVATASPSTVGDPSSWGPGSLVLEEGGTTWQTGSLASSMPSGPRWARKSFEEDRPAYRGKAGLKPLKLARSGSLSSHGRTSVDGSENAESVRDEDDGPEHRPQHSNSIATGTIANNRSQAGSGKKPSKDGMPRSAQRRPLPSDLPESPASSKRFTRAADQFDAAAVEHPLPPQANRSVDANAAPVVPIAQTRQAIARAARGRNKKSIDAPRPVVPPIKLSKKATEPKDDWPSSPGDGLDASTPVAAAPARRIPQRPKRHQTLNDVWTKQESMTGQAEVMPSTTPQKLPFAQKAAPRSSPPPPPEVPVSREPKPSTTKLPHQAIQGGHFARAAFAARRQMSSTSRSPTGSVSTVSSSEAHEEARREGKVKLHPRTSAKRSSLSSMQDFVPATLPAHEETKEGISTTVPSHAGSSVSAGGTSYTGSAFTETVQGGSSWATNSSMPSIAESGATVQSGQSWTSSSTISTKHVVKQGRMNRKASILSQATVMSRDSYAAGEADTVYIDRCALGPLDLSSPNKKGSQLILKASPATSELSIVWREEKKVVVSLSFDALEGVTLPGPDCDEHFVVLKPRTGSVREVLLEVDKANLLHFQRFLLILIAGAGADIEHIDSETFNEMAAANDW